MDLVSLTVAIVIGVVAGGLATFGLGRLKKPKVEKVSAANSTLVGKSVEETEMVRARRDLKTLLLEKELMAGALTRVYEAEAEGKITKGEREQLADKYREQLKVVEERLGDIELMIEVGELENLRIELVGLFEKKMGQIENRLNEAKVRLDQIKGVKMPPAESVVLEKVEDKKMEKRKATVAESKVDNKVRALRNEVLEALARLEQIDVEG